MYKHVVLKNLRLIEGFGTLVENIKLLPNMYQHVPLEMILLLEGCGTLVASIRLLPTMYQHVPLEMILLLEGRIWDIGCKNMAFPNCVPTCAFSEFLDY